MDFKISILLLTKHAQTRFDSCQSVGPGSAIWVIHLGLYGVAIIISLLVSLKIIFQIGEVLSVWSADHQAPIGFLGIQSR